MSISHISQARSPAPSVLAALPVFDAAARLGSFSAAAERLGVTQSAVSHRIKQLEAELGFALFHRSTRRLELTPEGARLAPLVGDALAGLAHALDDLGRRRAEGQLTLSVLSSLAVKWLVPRLGAFHAAQPRVRVSVIAQDALSDLRSGEIDVAIRYSKGPSPGLHATRIGGDWLVPVASPRLVDSPARAPFPADLARYPLLADSAGESDGTDYSWDAWRKALKARGDASQVPIYFNRADLMIQAAIAGQGIALARAMLLEDDLQLGSLLVPVGPAVPAAASYYLLTQPERAGWPKIAHFRDWIAQRMKASRQRLSKLLDLNAA